ncbi:LexA family protein [Moraxella catarrhalis]|uniref:LexA family protein n=1 Tax=Moraxella catarrhalis TaxID=480 RepID=UPI000720541D|nr:S24 family peptidase [Moraxella catarrhalis]AKI27331.1 hypothetical protein [Moraxella phage Mcat7]MPX83870.1 peptidase S24 [Moraxella catarrhalis]
MSQFERLNYYVSEHFGEKNQTKIAEKLGVSKSTFSNWASRGISKSGIEKINAVYGAGAVQYIMNGTEAPEIQRLRDMIRAKESSKGADLERVVIFDNSKTVPVISWVAAGSWADCSPSTLDDVIDELPRPNTVSDPTFALQVRGESMLPDFNPGEYIYVDPSYGFLDLKNGDLVVVLESDKHQATFKQLVIGETEQDMYLRPLNPDWPEQKMLPKSQWELVGKVVGKWVKY